jgi:hypothetical protein
MYAEVEFSYDLSSRRPFLRHVNNKRPVFKGYCLWFQSRTEICTPDRDTPASRETCLQNTTFSLLLSRDFRNIGLPFWGTSGSIYPHPCSDFTGYRVTDRLPRSPTKYFSMHQPHPAVGL